MVSKRALWLLTFQPQPPPFGKVKFFRPAAGTSLSCSFIQQPRVLMKTPGIIRTAKQPCWHGDEKPDHFRGKQPACGRAAKLYAQRTGK
jgi:hypothetical protein